MKSKICSILLTLGLVLSFGLVTALPVSAASAVDLGAASTFAILAGAGITAGAAAGDVITGDVGRSPGTGAGITGFGPAPLAVVNGTIYTTDAAGPAGYVTNPTLLTSAQAASTAAYGNAAGQTPATALAGADNQLGSQTLTPGIYSFGGATTANLIGTLTLNGQGNANAVFIFQASSSLVTAAGSVVSLINGAQAYNVFWQVTSSATLNAGSTFKGTILALTSISLVGGGVNVQGRLLAQTAGITLAAGTNTISVPSSPPIVGGIAYSINKANVLVPWLILPLIIVIGGGVWWFLRSRSKKMA